jgi:hypothetical protein
MSAEGRRLKETVKFYFQRLVSEEGGRIGLTLKWTNADIFFSSQLISSTLKLGDLLII